MQAACIRSRYYSACMVVLIVTQTSTKSVDAFDLIVSTTSTYSRTSTTTRLFSTPPPPQRQPRRDLQKRPRKNRKPSLSDQPQHMTEYTGTKYGLQTPSRQQHEDFPWDTAESRTIISAAAREAGEDYWIDVEELKRIEEVQRKQRRIKPRDPNQIPDQKLWMEVLSPYKQNWIGLISVSMIVFAFIFKYFPEVIDPPIITNIPAIL